LAPAPTPPLGVNTLVSESEPVYSSLSQSSAAGKSSPQFPERFLSVLGAVCGSLIYIKKFKKNEVTKMQNKKKQKTQRRR
jgi:hypothetical protein